MRVGEPFSLDVCDIALSANAIEAEDTRTGTTGQTPTYHLRQCQTRTPARSAVTGNPVYRSVTSYLVTR